MWREDLKGCTYTRSVTHTFLNISQYSQENTCVSFNEVADLQACNFIEMWILRKCFPVNIEKFLRTYMLNNISKQLLLRKQFLCLQKIDNI